MLVRVCVAVREATTAQAAGAVARVAPWADLVEIRADYIRDLDVRALLRQPRARPVLFTLRSRAEGGEYAGSERSRIQAMLEAARCGADYIDVEYSAYWRAVLDSVPAERVVVSYHDFKETPAGLERLAGEMAATGAGVVKLATTALSLDDNRRIADLLAFARTRNINMCALAMGRRGVPARILGPSWGSWMTFAAAPGGQPTADGQVHADVLVNGYRIRNITRDTQVFGTVGDPVGFSLAPAIHNAAFGARGADAVFLPLDAADPDDFFTFSQAFGVRGAGVQAPFREQMCARVDSLSVEADNTGAVNTLVRRQDSWHGENSEVEGFLRPLKRRTHVGKLKAVVLGAGGAARAVVFGLRSQGATVCVVARDAGKAQRLAVQGQAEWAPWAELERMPYDLLVNATPVGMYPNPDESPVAAEWLRGTWVYDLIAWPGETRLLKDARERGIKTIPGLEMMLAQAARQQLLWCGSPPPEGSMEAALQPPRQAPEGDLGSAGSDTQDGER